MFQKIIFNLLVVIFLSSCSTNLNLRDKKSSKAVFEEINSSTKGKKSELTFKNDKKLKVENVLVRKDSIFWSDSESGVNESALTSQVKQIKIDNRKSALKKGAKYGAVVGIFSGTLTGLEAYNTDHYDVGFFKAKGNKGLSTFYGVCCFLGEVFIGMVAGRIVDGYKVYNFSQEKPSYFEEYKKKNFEEKN